MERKLRNDIISSGKEEKTPRWGVAAVVGGLALSVGLLAGAPAQAQAPMGPAYVNVEALILNRDQISGTEFTGPWRPGASYVAFGPKDLKPGWSGGVRATVRVPFSANSGVEVSGFYAGDFGANRTIFDDNQNTSATYDDSSHLNPGADVSTSNSGALYALSIKHTTRLYGGELNWVNPFNFAPASWFTVLAGVRGIHFGERLKSVAYDEENDYQGTDNEIDRLSIRTDNNMIGAQIGVATALPLGSAVTWRSQAKAGFFANRITRKIDFSSDDDATNTLNTTVSGTGTAYMLETNSWLDIAVTQAFSLTLGTHMMWLSGVSEAARHYQTSTDADDTNLRNNGNVLIYGFTVGGKVKLN